MEQGNTPRFTLPPLTKLDGRWLLRYAIGKIITSNRIYLPVLHTHTKDKNSGHACMQACIVTSQDALQLLQLTAFVGCSCNFFLFLLQPQVLGRSSDDGPHFLSHLIIHG